MRRFLLALTALLCGFLASAQYVPSEGNLRAREEFASGRLGIFLHWGIYSTYAQGEWYLSTHNLNADAYMQAAGGFYPASFDAAAWAAAFRDAGASYVTLTSRHHDGFSLWPSAETTFDIADASPFGRDVLGELTAAVKAEGMRMQYYYSLIDWIRPDYPKGHSGVQKDASLADYDHYFEFEKAQIRELLSYGPGALWFDGMWDHEDEPDFPWRMEELYAFIHSIAPDCLIGNNHHRSTLEGEDFQMFERDLPGENYWGYSDQAVSTTLPLEMCQTMNGAWGYRVDDMNYKSVKELVQLLVRAASKGSNLLLNIGPQADGSLPAFALERLRGMGEWMRRYGSTVNGCGATGIPDQSWGVTTRNAGTVFLHILDASRLPSNGSDAVIVLPFPLGKVASVNMFDGGEKCTWKLSRDGFLSITLPVPDASATDTVISVRLK